MIPSMPRLARTMLALSAIGLAAGSAMHAFAFHAAQAAADRSSLPLFFRSAFKGLWLSDSGTSLALALVFGWIAANPRAATWPSVVALGLLPLASAAAIYATMGGFFAGHLMLSIGAMTIAAALLWPGTIHDAGADNDRTD
jgi:hypothetical protein